MKDLIVALIIIAIVGAAGLYIYRAKKRGVKCIGCPSGATCGAQGKGGCEGCKGGCHAEE